MIIALCAEAKVFLMNKCLRLFMVYICIDGCLSLYTYLIAIRNKTLLLQILLKNGTNKLSCKTDVILN